MNKEKAKERDVIKRRGKSPMLADLLVQIKTEEALEASKLALAMIDKRNKR